MYIIGKYKLIWLHFTLVLNINPSVGDNKDKVESIR